MITRIDAEDNSDDWRLEMAQTITDPKELFRRLKLDPSSLPAAYHANRQFRLRVTESYLKNIEPGNPRDPLLLQILPSGEETLPQPSGYSIDPVGDDLATCTPGTLHKYHGRVLLITTEACAIHCRYCFRRHFPYSESTAARKQWSPALEYLRKQTDVEEVILSGGDPLSLSDSKLQQLLEGLNSLSHIKRLRIHTRLPVVLPSRINDSLIAMLADSDRQTVMVIHANHPNEISADVRRALSQLSHAQIPTLNQTVLLNGINNDSSTLETLSKSLFENNVLPYYLHLLDKVSGAAHFEVPQWQAEEILQDLRRRLPGYLVPKLVREEPGEPSKTPV